MKFLAAAVILAGAASALPAVDIEARDLESRAITGPTRGYNCDGTAFTEAYITNAITHAAQLKYNQDPLKEMTKCDLSSTHARDLAFCQPKDYKNHATAATGVLHFPDCPSGPWYEFPLMADGHTLYDPPRAPGQGNPARVIFAYTSSTTAHFCGAVTHAAAAGHGDFISCT